MKNTVVLSVIIFILCGCADNSNYDAINKKRVEFRHALFVECMELAAKNTRQGDDDVSDIVSDCNDVAVYTSNQAF